MVDGAELLYVAEKPAIPGSNGIGETPGAAVGITIGTLLSTTPVATVVLADPPFVVTSP
jgi:hypothetical protein